MNIAKILMYTFKILLNESIERSGIGSLETISISERLDLLVVEEQKEIYKRYNLGVVWKIQQNTILN